MNQSNVIRIYEPSENSRSNDGFVAPSNPVPSWVFDSECFRHAQKMEAMGRLAAGVAHDFYNILTIIQGYAVLLGRGEHTRQEINEHLNQISAAANRGAILTRQLLAYSRRDGVQFEALDLNALIDNLSNMLQRLLGEDIVLETSFCPTLSPILGDTGTIEQVIMNLVVNARDAMPNGGRISVHVDPAQISPSHVQLHPQSKVGEFGCISVCDTGCGMGKELLGRVFEPFFTTKDSDKGTGLGLAIVQSIVEQHLGWIEVRSQPGVGTEFKVYFPCAPVGVVRTQRKLHAPRISSGHETILIVEDEEQLRGLAAHILKWHGYQVIQADNAQQALSIWQEKGDSIDLVLTDVALRGSISGDELVEKLRQRRPELRAVFTSGYSVGRTGQEATVGAGPHFVPKPYSPDRLVQAVQDCLLASP